MQAIKSAKTSFEQRITKSLWARGLRFRTNVRDLFGKPDIAVNKYKVVIFLDSCFWHGCKLHSKKPKTNADFWERKIAGNVLRDEKVNSHYSERGWRLLRVWEHDFKSDFEGTCNRIESFIRHCQGI